MQRDETTAKCSLPYKVEALQEAYPSYLATQKTLFGI